MIADALPQISFQQPNGDGYTKERCAVAAGADSAIRNRVGRRSVCRAIAVTVKVIASCSRSPGLMERSRSTVWETGKPSLACQDGRMRALHHCGQTRAPLLPLFLLYFDNFVPPETGCWTVPFYPYGRTPVSQELLILRREAKEEKKRSIFSCIPMRPALLGWGEGGSLLQLFPQECVTLS